MFRFSRQVEGKMWFLRLLVFFCLNVSSFTLCAQSEEYLKLYLFRYNNVISTGGDWFINNEFENTRSFSPDRQREILARTTLVRSIRDNLRVGQGFGYNTLYNTGAALWVPEWRIHQQIVHEVGEGNLQFMHRVRIEELFARPLESERLQPGRALTLRARYFMQLTYNLRGQSEEPGNLTASLWNEVYVFPLKENLFFTENHLNTGVIYQLCESMSIVLSHTWLLLQPSPDVYQQGSIFRFTVNQAFEL